MSYKYNRDLNNQGVKECRIQGGSELAAFGAAGWNVCEDGANASEPKCSY